MEKLLFTSESVTEGHPDKLCDAVSDAILDACIQQDPMSRVACETASCTGFILVTGEITTKAQLDIPAIVRKTALEIGYDCLLYTSNISVTDKKHKALCGSGVIEGMKVLLVKPQTYMNLSGESVAEVMNFYKLDPDEKMIVIFDDISLEPGRIRIRKKGSAGGHNGIKSIIAMTGTQGFSRIKVGVGEKPQGWDLADHVLGRFSSEDRAKVEEAIGHAMDAAVLMMQGLSLIHI